MPHSSPGARRTFRIAAVVAVLIGALGPTALPVAAAGGPTMEARVLLGGHARVGSWVAIAVHLKNDGPAIDGELRITGGTQSQTRFSVPADLPTQADKTFLLYAQPPAFGKDLQVQLVEGDTTVASVKAAYASDDGTQLVVAVVAEHPERLVGSFHLPPNQNQVAPLVMSLAPEDLPERVEAWTSVDRIVWQDVDADRLTSGQLAALSGWVAGGGKLVIVGGTTGPKALAGFPDALLPYRPDVTTDVPAASLAGILGELPPTATTLPALSGELASGRALATVGDPRRRRGTDIRRRHRDPPRVRPVGRLDREDRQLAGDVATPAATAHVRRPGHLRRQPARRRRVPGAEPRAAADRWPDPAPHRLHRPDRADQLLRPATARSS